MGQGSAGLAGLEIDEPDNEADWPKDEQWRLAIDINSPNHCPLRRGWACEAHADDKVHAVANKTTAEMVRACEAFCGSDKLAGDFRKGDGHACGLDLVTLTCTKCASYKTLPSINAGAYAGVCLPNTDFVYTSPLWHAEPGEFSEGDRPGDVFDGVHPGTTAGNRLLSAYTNSLVTHVRVKMNGRTVDFAVAVSLSGRYTLKDLVTDAGGSPASRKGDGNAKWTTRGMLGSAFGYSGKGVVCTNVGLNHLLTGGDEDGSTGWKSFSQGGPRVRIGVYTGSKFPCAKHTGAEGVGMDTEYSRPVGPGGQGGRLNSGSLSTTSPSSFSAAQVYVSTTFPTKRALRTDAYAQFGDAKKYLMQDVLEETHASLPFGVKGGSYHFTFSLFYQFRRDYHWNPGWEHRNIFRYGSSSREFLPALNWVRSYRHQGWSPRIYWSNDYMNPRKLEWIMSTNRVVNGNEDYYASYQGESTIHLTNGRWHHLAMSVNRHSVTTYIDGSVHGVYVIPPGDSNLDVQIKIARERLLHLAETKDRRGSRIFDFKVFNDAALSQRYVQQLASLYPPNSCGDGFRAQGETCDDGNIVPGDGCDASCQIEDGWICRGGNTTSVAADKCSPGTYMLDVTFEEAEYKDAGSSLAAVDTTVYQPSKWRRQTSLPRLHELERTDGGISVRRRGNVLVEVGEKFAQSGAKGMRLRFRDYYYTSEYVPHAI